MAGPVYYSDLFPGETGLPEYYSGKVLIYDWMRGWMKAVSLFDNGDFKKIEPFAAHIKVHSLIDMELGPDGKVYLLEYGSGWYTRNSDAGLARIEYLKGNLPPEIKRFEVDKVSGQLPLKVRAEVSARDIDGDELRYMWNFGDGQTEETKVPATSHTYESPEEFEITVEVFDGHNAPAQSEAIRIYAGNELPKVEI